MKDAKLAATGGQGRAVGKGLEIRNPNLTEKKRGSTKELLETA